MYCLRHICFHAPGGQSVDLLHCRKIPCAEVGHVFNTKENTSRNRTLRSSVPRLRTSSPRAGSLIRPAAAGHRPGVVTGLANVSQTLDSPVTTPGRSLSRDHSQLSSGSMYGTGVGCTSNTRSLVERVPPANCRRIGDLCETGDTNPS